MFFIKKKLSLLIMYPLISCFALIIIPKKYNNLLKIVSLNFAGFIFLESLIILLLFKKHTGAFQFSDKINWFPNLNLNVTLGVDGISLLFIVLTTLLVFLCLLISWESIKKNLKFFLILFFLLEFFLIAVFCVLDLLFFYVFFESVLIPMFLMIGIWGSRERKIRAAYFFFFYTLLGSILMLLAIIYIYNQVGSTDYEVLLSFKFNEMEQRFLWLAFFSSFASKIPMFPMHLWLPEAHVEAPTAGSVILAGILLKLGVYGFLRFSFPLFPKACFYFAPLVYTLSVVGVLYASFTAIRQTDFKRIIAYTSIAHMNLVMIGLFSFNSIGIQGAILQSLSHGFVASGLFLLIGVVYERHKTRLIKYYGGLAHTMPLYVSFFLFFTLANIGFPGTGSFIGEFLILSGSFKINTSITFFSAFGMVIGACYSLWLFNRICYGNIKSHYINMFSDLNQREVLIFIPLILGTFILGICPKIFSDYITMNVNVLVELMYF